jgi:hypothetical protein
MIEDPKANPNKREPMGQDEISKLLEIIKSVSHGSVSLIIQDGIVIQIDRNEKLRFKKNQTTSE